MSMGKRKLHMLRSNDGKNQEIWVGYDEWMRPRDIISEGSEMPPEILGLLKKWSKEINHIRDEFQSKANIGYAHMDFVYDSSVYKLQQQRICSTILRK